MTYSFVWDTSAIVNIKEPDETGYSPAHSLWKDLSDGWLGIEYRNIIPTIAVFEVNATVSKLERKKKPILRDFYLIDDRTSLYDIDSELVRKSQKLVELEGFQNLYGADLVFACVAHVENATLITMDSKLAMHSAKQLKVIDLNKSKRTANYRSFFDDI